VVAVVLVSSRFLLSHAYLKDSAVCILACSVAKRGPSHSPDEGSDAGTIDTAAQSAFKQARQELKDLTATDAQHSVNSDLWQALNVFDTTQRQDTLQSSNSPQGITGLSNLCESGQVSQRGSLLVFCLLILVLSLATAWVDESDTSSKSNGTASHFKSGRVSSSGHPLPL